MQANNETFLPNEFRVPADGRMVPWRRRCTLLGDSLAAPSPDPRRTDSPDRVPGTTARSPQACLPESLRVPTPQEPPPFAGCSRHCRLPRMRRSAQEPHPFGTVTEQHRGLHRLSGEAAVAGAKG
ncbi:unnamed protein product [Miscanthus lutarioriparius]|uniref:Uncharacterized protein n=1 Tax=Miscanthus lutarioriparius TaxID=422564 RepID=A0A811R3G0_9POAL|nr:unnamed protein product [Miscanthus lutarioriparius]